MTKTLSVLLLAALLAAGMPEPAGAEPDARIITEQCTVLLNGQPADAALTDGSEETFLQYDSAEITVSAPEPIGAVYVVFDRTPSAWTLLCGAEKNLSCGTNGFLHEYQPVEDESVTEVTLCFDTDVSVADLFILSRGDRPAFVQAWRPAEGPCDLLLLACHADDDQLFFAGAIPDAVARGAEVQVCYFTNHWSLHTRPHELLNGLWACGLDRYPVIGPFPDVRRVSEEQTALEDLEALGFSYKDMAAQQTELLRRFRPQVVLGHDRNGEYGHGAHMLSAHVLLDAVLAAAQPDAFPESAEAFGVWDVPKVYLHLLEQDPIDFEIDRPLARFNGRTAFSVSQSAFLCHISQQITRYRTWLLGNEEEPAADSSVFPPEYSPRRFGLWRSLVGKDTVKTDFYEHITLRGAEGSPAAQPTETPMPTPTATPAETASPAPPADGSGRSPFPVLPTVLMLLSLIAAGAGSRFLQRTK